MKSLTRIAAALVALAVPALVHAQAAKGPKTIVVKMIDKSPTEFGFEPANITANPGDVIKFVQTSTTPHNIDFKTTPAGVDLGAQKTGPFLTSPNATYEITLDAKFAKGTYSFVCTPHEAMGMKGTFTVGEAKVAAAGK